MTELHFDGKRPIAASWQNVQGAEGSINFDYAKMPLQAIVAEMVHAGHQTSQTTTCVHMPETCEEMSQFPKLGAESEETRELRGW